jgi:Icc-related predicted phosphoesterase
MPLFRRRGEGRRFTRLFFTSDLHGSDACFMKFLNAADAYRATVLVLGGDITGKVMVPVVRRDGRWEAEVFGERRTAETDDELADIERLLRRNGFYPYRTTSEELEELERDKSRMQDVFLGLMRESISRWMEMAEDKLGGRDIRCFVNLGNDDQEELKELIEASDVVTYPDGKVVEIDDDHSMASLGYSNMTPWRCPRDVPDEELARKIEALAPGVPDMSRCIFNFHVPPYDSNLDLAPELTDELKPLLAGGQPKMAPIGSRAVRQALERYQPLAALHGHVHESRGTVEIGRTLCINPGSEYSEGLVRGVLLNIRSGEILSHQFVSG